MATRPTVKDLEARLIEMEARMDKASQCMAAQMKRIAELERTSHVHAATKHPARSTKRTPGAGLKAAIARGKRKAA